MTERLDAFIGRANAAYYGGRDPFADFTTAPEISQCFGEVLGLWAAVTWRMLGAPAPVALVEAGPGRGTLMADALRAIRQAMPDFAAALSVHFIETSPRLRAEQAARVPEATWHGSLDSVPVRPMLLLANEFLDALPIRQFVRRGAVWHERFVADGAFVEHPGDPPVPPPPDSTDGAVWEVNEAAIAFVREVTERTMVAPGAALFVDYGPAVSGFGDTLQALKGGQPADPLADPGTADLTAHVDFATLAAVARQAGASVHGPRPQGLFLAELGLFQRANRLAERQSPRDGYATMLAARRLGEPDGMGRLFKAMAVVSPGCPVLPGFDAT